MEDLSDPGALGVEVAALVRRLLRLAQNQGSFSRAAAAPAAASPVRQLLDGAPADTQLVIAAPTAGPQATLKAFCKAVPTAQARSDWLREAYSNALLGSCPRSVASVRSGIRCWLAFAREVLGLDQERALPPSVRGLVAWSMQFRCAGTYSSYLCHVRFGTLLAGASTCAFEHEAVKRAKAAVSKRMLFVSRPRHFINLPLLERLVEVAALFAFPYRFLWIIAYAFLLRVPSEALPLHAGDLTPQCEHTAGLFFRNGEMHLRLRRRKNRPHGSLLVRGCWCSRSPSTCPVHAVESWLAGLRPGDPLFPGLSAAEALRVLRGLLDFLNVERASEYRTHDFRRGHAEAVRCMSFPARRGWPLHHCARICACPVAPLSRF